MMVSVGRGRGRGWAANDEVPLPRPGKRYSEDKNYTDLANIINAAVSKNLLQNNKEVERLVDDAAKSNNLQAMHEELYKYAIQDKVFGSKLFIVYADHTIKQIHDSDNKNLYRYLINNLQLNFGRREKLREENIEHFHNNIRLFSMFLTHDATMQYKMTFFKSVLLTYMEMLLETASTDDIEIFVEQIVVHGPYLYSQVKEKIDDLMLNARKILLKEDTSITSRQMLLYAIDLQGRNFHKLPKDLKLFYSLQLGDKEFLDRGKII